ncbi:MAG: hypothetical protein Q8R37_00305 [Nanoarchaeota archaeon]|nr:hypothetical protein [Nanoarchaeota archaeon]
MTKYKKVEFSDLVERRLDFNYKNIEVVGRITSPLSFYVDLYYEHNLFAANLVHLSSPRYLSIKLREIAGFLWKMELEQKIRFAYESKLPIQVKGYYQSASLHRKGKEPEELYVYDVPYLYLHQAEFPAGNLTGRGELSLVDDLEGSLSLHDINGNLSLK